MVVGDEELFLFNVPNSSYKILKTKPMAMCQIEYCDNIAFALCDINDFNYEGFNKKCGKKICYKHCV